MMLRLSAQKDYVLLPCRYLLRQHLYAHHPGDEKASTNKELPIYDFGQMVIETTSQEYEIEEWLLPDLSPN